MQSTWFRVSIGQFQLLGRKYHRTLEESNLLGTLRRLVFNEVEPEIASVVKGFGVLPI